MKKLFILLAVFALLLFLSNKANAQNLDLLTLTCLPFKLLPAVLHQSAFLFQFSLNKLTPYRRFKIVVTHNFFSFSVKVTRIELITVWRNAFSRLACVHFCKATALLQISHFAFQKKAKMINSST